MADNADDQWIQQPGGRGSAPRPEPEPDEDAPPVPSPPRSNLRLPQVIARPDHVRCPFCLAVAEQYVVGLSSGLGPPLLRCRNCGHILLSLRREWIDMAQRQKAWYVGMSILYALALAAAVAPMTWFALFLVRASLPFWAILLYAAVWAAAVAVVQRWRVMRSLRRTRSLQRTPHLPSYWSLDHGWTLRFLMGAVAMTAVLAWLTRLMKP